MTPSEEKALIARAKRDPEAFGRIFDAHFDAIFRFTLHRVADAASAEDLTSQTFFKALSSLWKFRWSGVPLSAWLFRIAANEVNGYLRRLKRRPAANVESAAAGLSDGRGAPDEELVAAEEALARQQRFLKLHDAVSELRPADQSLIALRYFEGKPFSEIARILGKREGSLRMRNMRALEKLKGHLRERGISDEELGRHDAERAETRGEGRRFSAKTSK